MSTVRLFPTEPERPAFRLPIAWGVGLALLAESLGSSIVLVLQHLQGLELPGCGPQSACALLASGTFGSLGPFPLSVVGVAWFAGMLVGWALSLRGLPDTLRWAMRLGALASLFYVGVMVWQGHLCPYCLAVHVANLLAWVCAERLPALQAAGATWLEEPFVPHAFVAHAALAARAGAVGLAGGEGAYNTHMATNLIDYGGVRFIQIDAARIGGIGPSKAVADHAVARGVTYVNHTFTSHLALSASMQPFAGLAEHRICEYPAEPKQVALDLSRDHILPDANGEVRAPDAPGLGIEVDLDGLAPYLRTVEILIDGSTVFRSPDPRPVLETV